MPLKPGKENFQANFHELRHGKQFAKTEAAHGEDTARRQMVAIALKEARKRAQGGRAKAEKALPADHQLGMRVPEGGSMCANCRFLSGPDTCGNPAFVRWNGGKAKLPQAANRYCCDLWERGYLWERPWENKRHSGKADGGEVHNPVRAALAEVRRAKGGKVHVGPIKGDKPGRTDVHDMKVPDGAYVLSADVISHLGQNNTQAGLKIAQHLFGEGGKLDQGRSAGGKTSGTGKPVDCVTAGGEFVVPPSVVTSIGNGDLELGHRILDKWSMNIRKDHIRTLKSLPPPARD